MGVPITTVLEHKGSQVATVVPNDTVADVVVALREHRIGALVVIDDAGAVIGIVSERDVVRHLAGVGGKVLDLRVSDVMTSPVHACEPSNTTDELMEQMTERRIRHLPVVHDGRLVGIVSIGDVVKWRFEELREEKQHLEDYVAGSY